MRDPNSEDTEEMRMTARETRYKMKKPEKVMQCDRDENNIRSVHMNACVGRQCRPSTQADGVNSSALSALIIFNVFDYLCNVYLLVKRYE